MKDDFRKQKDLKVLNAFIYKGITGITFLNITLLDKRTENVYAGNIPRTFKKLKDWKNRHKEIEK